ncbi:MAG: hypothetical protein AABY32_01195 [Nanoarchaeota archaeon]
MLSVDSKQVNNKCIISADFTTNCPRRRNGTPCKYCYVESSRNNKWNPKPISDYLPYTGWVKRIRNHTKFKLKKAGGLRLFSYGDYMPEHDKDIILFLDDCSKYNVDVKVITKQRDFIKKYHNHPAIKVIHISIDNLKENGSHVSHKSARFYRNKYKKVLVRSVACNWDDVNKFGKAKWCDIITLNHKIIPGKRFHLFSKNERKEANNIYPGKICCITNHCNTCKIKCRKNKE